MQYVCEYVKAKFITQGYRLHNIHSKSKDKDMTCITLSHICSLPRLAESCPGAQKTWVKTPWHAEQYSEHIKKVLRKYERRNR